MSARPLEPEGILRDMRVELYHGERGTERPPDRTRAPRRPPKCDVPHLAGHDPTRLDTLSPHPVNAWMGWAQILSPTAARFEGMRPLLAESLGLVRHRWKRRAA